MREELDDVLMLICLIDVFLALLSAIALQYGFGVDESVVSMGLLILLGFPLVLWVYLEVGGRWNLGRFTREPMRRLAELSARWRARLGKGEPEAPAPAPAPASAPDPAEPAFKLTIPASVKAPPKVEEGDGDDDVAIGPEQLPLSRLTASHGKLDRGASIKMSSSELKHMLNALDEDDLAEKSHKGAHAEFDKNEDSFERVSRPESKLRRTKSERRVDKASAKAVKKGGAALVFPSALPAPQAQVAKSLAAALAEPAPTTPGAAVGVMTAERSGGVPRSHRRGSNLALGAPAAHRRGSTLAAGGIASAALRRGSTLPASSAPVRGRASISLSSPLRRASTLQQQGIVQSHIQRRRALVDDSTCAAAASRQSAAHASLGVSTREVPLWREDGSDGPPAHGPDSRQTIRDMGPVLTEAREGDAQQPGRTRRASQLV